MISLRSLPALIAAAGIFAIAAPSAFAQENRLTMYLPASTPSVAHHVQDATAPVLATLNQFDSAIATHDIALLQAVGIQPSRAKSWQRFFRDNPDASVTDNCPATSLNISGDTASWDCVETATVISDRKPVSFTRLIRFTFTNTNGAWMISDRR